MCHRQLGLLVRLLLCVLSWQVRILALPIHQPTCQGWFGLCFFGGFRLPLGFFSRNRNFFIPRSSVFEDICLCSSVGRCCGFFFGWKAHYCFVYSFVAVWQSLFFLELLKFGVRFVADRYVNCLHTYAY